MSQARRLPRGYLDDERDETMLIGIADAPSKLDSTLHSVPVTKGGIIPRGRNVVKLCFN